MKIMYTRPDDNGVNIVVAAPKESIEKVLGLLTQEQYEAHVMERSVPADALNVKIISDENIPADREFRNAWVDVTQDNKINIDLSKAKDIKLAELRAIISAKLDALDKKVTEALDKGQDVTALREAKQALRDATNPLKSLVVSGVDDPKVLQQIRDLGRLNE